MSLPPAPQRSACLMVLKWAALEARVIGWSGQQEGLPAEEAQRLAQLMDAVHNIPGLMQRWDSCDEQRLMDDLRTYDERWGARSRVRLLGEYLSGLASAGQPPPP